MTLLDSLRLLQQGEWGRAPPVAQADETRRDSWLHGIVHMVEPDKSDSCYWYRAAGRPFPGMGGLASEMGEFERAYDSDAVM